MIGILSQIQCLPTACSALLWMHQCAIQSPLLLERLSLVDRNFTKISCMPQSVYYGCRSTNLQCVLFALTPEILLLMNKTHQPDQMPLLITSSGLAVTPNFRAFSMCCPLRWFYFWTESTVGSDICYKPSATRVCRYLFFSSLWTVSNHW